MEIINREALIASIIEERENARTGITTACVVVHCCGGDHCCAALD